MKNNHHPHYESEISRGFKFGLLLTLMMAMLIAGAVTLIIIVALGII